MSGHAYFTRRKHKSNIGASIYVKLESKVDLGESYMQGLLRPTPRIHTGVGPEQKKTRENEDTPDLPFPRGVPVCAVVLVVFTAFYTRKYECLRCREVCAPARFGLA